MGAASGLVFKTGASSTSAVEVVSEVTGKERSFDIATPP
jgi:hypothetical protein